MKESKIKSKKVCKSEVKEKVVAKKPKSVVKVEITESYENIIKAIIIDAGKALSIKDINNELEIAYLHLD